MGCEHHLESYQIPVDLVLASELFSVSNGMMTGSGKLDRQAINRNYRLEIDDIFKAAIDTARSVDTDDHGLLCIPS